MMAIDKWEYEKQFLAQQRGKLQNLLLDLHKYGVREGEAVTYLNRKLADATRQIDNSFGYNNQTKAMPMGEDLYEFRYEAHGGEYKLKCWHDGKEETMHGAVDTQPEWLTGIVDVAKIAGHLKTPISPPPEVILWFHTDKNRTLINFIELAP
jgi:hypothetical protein